MKRIESSLNCPACQGELRPTVLTCEACGIRVEGPFVLNEFATLSADDLHFLRIFVQAEGRIRDMEAALGLSYPTIRTRLTALRTRLAEGAPDRLLQGPAGPDASAPAGPARHRSRGKARLSPAQDALDQLEAGGITFEEALRRIKANTPTP